MAKEKRMIRNVQQIREYILLSLGRKSDVPWSERFENDILWLARVESDVFLVEFLRMTSFGWHSLKVTS